MDRNKSIKLLNLMHLTVGFFTMMSAVDWLQSLTTIPTGAHGSVVGALPARFHKTSRHSRSYSGASCLYIATSFVIIEEGESEDL